MTFILDPKKTVLLLSHPQYLHEGQQGTVREYVKSCKKDGLKVIYVSYWPNNPEDPKWHDISHLKGKVIDIAPIYPESFDKFKDAIDDFVKIYCDLFEIGYTDSQLVPVRFETKNKTVTFSSYLELDNNALLKDNREILRAIYEKYPEDVAKLVASITPQAKNILFAGTGIAKNGCVILYLRKLIQLGKKCYIVCDKSWGGGKMEQIIQSMEFILGTQKRVTRKAEILKILNEIGLDKQIGKTIFLVSSDEIKFKK